MLTPKQLTLLQFMSKYLAQNGVIPSYDEMRLALGLKSKSGIAALIQELERKGYVRKVVNKARALEILKFPEETNAPKEYVGDNVLEGGDVSHMLGIDARQPSSAYITVHGNIAAGLPLEVFERGDEKIELPQSLLGGSRSVEDYFALRIVGSSMVEAGIIDGDIVVLLKTNTAKPGEIVAALIDHDEVTLKRFHVHQENIVLEPANKDFIPQEYAIERVKILGRLAHLIRKYN